MCVQFIQAWQYLEYIKYTENVSIIRSLFNVVHTAHGKLIVNEVYFGKEADETHKKYYVYVFVFCRRTFMSSYNNVDISFT